MSQTPCYESDVKKVLMIDKCQRSTLFPTLMQFIINFRDLEARKYYLVKIAFIVFK